MKNMFITIFVSIMLTSCIKDIDTNLNKKYNEASNLSTTEEYYVTTIANYVSVVSVNDVEIAEIVTPTNIMIPRNSTPHIEYVPMEDYPNESINKNKTQLFQVICFEDSIVGDYDYNDFVFHVKYLRKGNIFGMYIQPIALGSVKDIKLGCTVYHRDKIIFDGLISEKKVRDSFFLGESGFINTFSFQKETELKERFLMNWKLEGIGSDVPVVEWFILVDNNMKLYALSTHYSNMMFNKNGLPYGIVITNTGLVHYEGTMECGYDWFNYPEELTHISSVYPKMWEWLSGNKTFDFKDFYSDELKKGIYPASVRGLYIMDKNIDPCDSKYRVN